MQYMDKSVGCLRTKCEKEMDTCAQKNDVRYGKRIQLLDLFFDCGGGDSFSRMT